MKKEDIKSEDINKEKIQRENSVEKTLRGHKERLNGDGRCNKKSEYMKRSGEKNTHIQSTFGAIHI